jgi:hypothetical protein
VCTRYARAAATTMSHEHIGERYRILSSVRTTPIYRELLALDLRERREVTLWVIEPQLAPDAATQKRFMMAARQSQKANLPSTMQVVGGGVARGMTYLVVAPNGADCLRVRLLRWRPSTREIASIVGQLATAVNGAHELGTFHGLLTARDVLFVNDRVMLAGMGMWTALARRPLLAALRHEASGLAPEARQEREKIGPRSDIYSVAAIAAEMLHVSTGASLTELRQNGWNPLLVEALDRALAHGTNARPPTLAGLQTALTVRAPDAVRRQPSQQVTQIEMTHDSQEATLLRDQWLPAPRLADGRPAAPPPAPAVRKTSQPPPVPRATTSRRAAGAGRSPQRPRLLRRATTYSGNR